MQNPESFIAWSGVLNTSCLTVLTIFSITGFYGYLAFGDSVQETVTLNLPSSTYLFTKLNNI